MYAYIAFVLFAPLKKQSKVKPIYDKHFSLCINMSVCALAKWNGSGGKKK